MQGPLEPALLAGSNGYLILNELRAEKVVFQAHPLRHLP
ncbi:hypothetical protein SAMN05444004_1365 [Jannaschia faecimaris]|uniref:Uncharacterized protein n=1 Tax=Jannaschia faecimaris TaxID=1244108 RepID=A0A1H3UHI9_9RHOB|nr:hypothetical protein SAMN05444004_1365 [Jannaschia faecimaris]